MLPSRDQVFVSAGVVLTTTVNTWECMSAWISLRRERQRVECLRSDSSGSAEARLVLKTPSRFPQIFPAGLSGGHRMWSQSSVRSMLFQRISACPARVFIPQRCGSLRLSLSYMQKHPLARRDTSLIHVQIESIEKETALRRPSEAPPPPASLHDVEVL